MWKVFTGLHRASVGGFRASLREDRPSVPGHRVLHILNNNQGCQSVACVSTSVAPSSPQTSSSSLTPCLQPSLSLQPYPSPSLTSPCLQPSPSLHSSGGSNSNTLSLHFAPRYKQGYEEDREGWSIVEVLHYSTALALSYNLIHHQNEVSPDCCPVRAVKKSKLAYAQPIQEHPRRLQRYYEQSELPSPKPIESDLSSLKPIESSSLKTNGNLDYLKESCLSSQQESSLTLSSLKLTLNENIKENKEHLEEQISSSANDTLELRAETTPGDKLENQTPEYISENQTPEYISENQTPEYITESQTHDYKLENPVDSANLNEPTEHVNVAEPGEVFSIELDSVHGVQLLEQGNPQGIHELRRQSRRGSSVASFYLGTAYEQGHLVPMDLVTARRFYQRAAAAGNPEAEYNLAVFYLHGRGGLGLDEGAARRLLESAAAGGVAQAKTALGIQETELESVESKKRNGRDLYMLGRSFENLGETKVAAEMYSLAVNSGYTRAKRRLNSLSS